MSTQAKTSARTAAHPPRRRRSRRSAPAQVETKRCSGCAKDLELSRFHFKDRASGRRQSRCIDCAAESSRRHYEANSAAVKERAQARNAEVRVELAAIVAAARAEARCADCGVAHAERDVQFTAPEGARRVTDVVAGALSVQTLREALEASVPLCHRCVTARRFAELRADEAQLAAGPTADMLVADAVVAAVVSAPEPVTFPQIVDALASAGRTDSRAVLRTTLAKVHKAGRVVRVARGVYGTPSRPKRTR